MLLVRATEKYRNGQDLDVVKGKVLFLNPAFNRKVVIRTQFP